MFRRLALAPLMPMGSPLPTVARPLLPTASENGPDHGQATIVQPVAGRVRGCCAGRIGAGFRRDGTLHHNPDRMPAPAGLTAVQVSPP